MKKLYLHIGTGKTGSSALQSWLSLNAKALRRQGIDYADLAPEAKHGAISSGNGYQLLHALRESIEEAERLINTVYFYSESNHTAIISSEILQGINPVFIQQISDICEKNDIEVTIIAYARSIYEKAYSAYLQEVKRNALVDPFSEESVGTNFIRNVNNLKRYSKVFGDRFRVLNYDAVKHDIYSSFAAIVGVDTRDLQTPQRRVNRSLTLEEAEVFRRINALHDGRFSGAISDFVIAQNPDLKTSVLYDKHVVDRIRLECAEGLRWINEQFRVDPPLVADFYSGEESKSDVSLTRESFQSVLHWSLKFMPPQSNHDEFLRFLANFSALLADVSPDDARLLRGRAEALAKNMQRVQS